MSSLRSSLTHSAIRGPVRILECLASTVLVSLLLSALGATAAGTAATDARDFSVNGVGWIASDANFLSPKSGPGPVTSDPAHPHVPNNAGAQPTFWVADLDNPILMPWVKDQLRNRNEVVLSGKLVLTRPNRCWPGGVPAILLAIIQPVFFIQTPNEVWQIWQNDHYVRRIYLNQGHSAHPKSSWFGESVGHYEDDTLVVDTIGLNTKTYLDNFNTPHTDKLHVVERYHLINGGRTLEVNITVDDPGAFNMPWSAIQRFRRVQQGPMLEARCAENNLGYFNYEVDPIPQSDTPEF
jgi:hypothetical protein